MTRDEAFALIPLDINAELLRETQQQSQKQNTIPLCQLPLFLSQKLDDIISLANSTLVNFRIYSIKMPKIIKFVLPSFKAGTSFIGSKKSKKFSHKSTVNIFKNMPMNF